MTPRKLRAPARRNRYVDFYHVASAHAAPAHIEEDDIPWPFFFSIRDDPFFDRRQPRMRMQPPPPSFRPTRPLTPLEQEAYNQAQVQPPPNAIP